MTLLEQIIFTADYIEPGRKQAPNLTQIRHLAFTDLNAAVTKILEDTLEYLKSGDGEMDPMTGQIILDNTDRSMTDIIKAAGIDGNRKNGINIELTGYEALVIELI